ncbi:MAG: hypothetical protein COB35_08115 [Gammaproteobacteria bacterium]|nr:MAG: hypothetical protein COB35_08115 [Gammaproteobacteria bacterium]
MDLIKVVDNLSADMYLRLKLAVETGKWPEGTEVAAQQRESALQLVMAYQSRVLKSDEIMTVGADGNIVNKSKKELQTQFAETNTLNSNDIARFSKL